MIDSSWRRARGRALMVMAGAMVLAAPAQADAPTPFELSYSPIILDDSLALQAAAAPEVEEEASSEAVGEGEASYYGHELAGNRTASGERFDPAALTAAHRTLPLGSKLKVTNRSNGRSVVVRINDRGPFAKKRILDVSLAAARKIGMLNAGKALVKLELLR